MPGEYFEIFIIPQKSVTYEAIRDLYPGEPGYYGDTVIKTGDRLYKFTGNDYMLGVLPGGVMMSLHGCRAYPIFEAPLDAFKVVDDVTE